MSEKDQAQNIGDILKGDLKQKKSAAYLWQDLALRVIKELNIPSLKRSAVFKVCRDNSYQFIENCLNDTKELAQTKEKWMYFFKLSSQAKKKPQKK